MSKGFLLVIDGIDGSGKSTQIELLTKYFEEKNIAYEVISFPQYGQNLFADLITRYLDGEFGTLDQVNPYLIALAYAGDRLLAKPVIENWLNLSKVVIANRYVSASKAHLGAILPAPPAERGESEEKLEEFLSWINNLEYKTNNMPKEDLTILLKVDPKLGQQNVLDDHQGDLHEKSLEHEIKAGKIYSELSQVEENWKIIECMEEGKMKSKQEIFKLIVEIVDTNLVT